MDQADRNPREQNQQGGQNKPRRPDSKEDDDKSRDEQEGRDQAPRNRPGGEKSPWLGGG
jgi:hypothetical protein